MNTSIDFYASIFKMKNPFTINMLERFESIQENIKSISPLNQVVELKNFPDNLMDIKNILIEKGILKVKDWTKKMYLREQIRAMLWEEGFSWLSILQLDKWRKYNRKLSKDREDPLTKSEENNRKEREIGSL